MCYFLTKCCAMLSPSVMSDSAILRTAARQAPLSMGFPRQEDWSGLPFLPPGDLPGIAPLWNWEVVGCPLPNLEMNGPCWRSWESQENLNFVSHFVVQSRRSMT